MDGVWFEFGMYILVVFYIVKNVDKINNFNCDGFIYNLKKKSFFIFVFEDDLVFSIWKIFVIMFEVLKK